MNLNAITKPLTEKMGDLTAVLQDVLDSLKAQTKLLESINEKLTKEKP